MGESYAQGNWTTNVWGKGKNKLSGFVEKTILRKTQKTPSGGGGGVCGSGFLRPGRKG